MKNSKIKRMVSVALLMALVLVMQMLSGIIPPIGGFSISLVLIPIVLGAAVFGPGVGALLGATFGVIVYINCWTGVDPFGAIILQANPILCFAVVMCKGIFAGAVSGIMYRLLCKVNGYVAMLIAAIVCPVVNTGIFVFSLLTLFKDALPELMGLAQVKDEFTLIMSVILLFNFVPELIINVVFSPAGQRIYNVVKK